MINGLDISLVSSNWLQHTAVGDANGDGVVNGLDIAQIAANWLVSDGGGSGTSVPEPSTAVLAAAAFALALVARGGRSAGRRSARQDSFLGGIREGSIGQ